MWNISSCASKTWSCSLHQISDDASVNLITLNCTLLQLWQADRKQPKKHVKRGSTSELVFLTLKILHESYYKQVMMVYSISYEITLLFKVWIYDGIHLKDYILLSQVSKSEDS